MFLYASTNVKKMSESFSAWKTLLLAEAQGLTDMLWRKSFKRETILVLQEIEGVLKFKKKKMQLSE